MKQDEEMTLREGARDILHERECGNVFERGDQGHFTLKRVRKCL
jgi:hypothetical protein